MEPAFPCAGRLGRHRRATAVTPAFTCLRQVPLQRLRWVKMVGRGQAGGYLQRQSSLWA